MKRKTKKTVRYQNRGRAAKKKAGKGGARSLVSDHRKKKNGARSKSSSRSATTVVGTFDYSGNGYGFCRIDGSGTDVFIPADETKGAMTGDRVSVAVRGTDGSGRVEGSVVSVEEHVWQWIVGTAVPVGARFYLKPRNPKLRITCRIDGGVAFSAGDLLRVASAGSDGYFARLPRRASEEDPLTGKREPPVPCRAVKNYGDAGKRAPNCEAVLESSGVPIDFPQAELDEAASVASAPVATDGRVDLRDEFIFTLDGAGAKDLDDAVSLKKKKDGYVLGVHIADVSYYVREGGALDLCAADRGTSVYFTDRVVPMLPVALSNGCCSLNGGVDRYAISVLIDLDRRGNRTGATLFRSVIRSRLRGVYSEANDVLERGEESAYYEKYAGTEKTLSLMWEVASLLKEKRDRCGSVELAEDEAAIILGEDGEPVGVERIERGKTERVIEQFMLEANIAVASLGRDEEIPFVYRVHEDPSPEKLASLGDALFEIGVDPHGVGAAPPAASYRAIGEILEEAKNRSPETFDTVSGIVLRSMMKAKYAPSPSRHFGIGADIYCHFTSPIRRYPDLFIHRELARAAERSGGALRSVTPEADGTPREALKNASAKAARAAAVSTETELRAVAAEREIESLYIASYMSGMIGGTFDAAVSSATPYGLFVRLGNTAEGLVPISEFGDGASCSKSGATMTTAGGTYRLGDKIKVRLTAADVSTGKLTFSIC